MKRILSILLIALCTLGVQAQYGIRVNGTDVYPATQTGEFEGFTQYLAHIYINVGDYCELYDINNAVAWTKPLNAASVSAFTLQNNRYVCSAAGCYDFYIKLKFNADELYIGPGTDCTNTPGEGGGGGTTPVTPGTYGTAVPSQCTDVMLQAFYWLSNSDNAYGTSKWTVLKNQASEINSYFDLVWLPPSCRANDAMGYLPKKYANQGSNMGSENDLKSLIGAFHNGGTRVVADVVINHAANKDGWADFWDQDFGTYGHFYPQSTWITSNDEAAGKGYTLGSNADDGQHNANYPDARDWDHKNSDVQAMCKAYLKYLKNTIGYDGFRFDYAGGYHVSHIRDYVREADPYFSVMEYWDGNVNNLKSRIDDASQATLTFDFAAYYTALQNGIAKNSYSGCRNAGMRSKGYSKYAVLFVDNHDTFNRSGATDPVDVGGSKDGRTTLNNRDLMLQCNAYILSMPGVPCVFWPHWYTYKSEIKAMITARKKAGIHSESTISEQSGSGWYKATVNGKYGNVILYLGSAASEAAPAGYTQAIKDGKVAMYYTGNGNPQDIESIQPSDVSNQKFVKDGQLYIRCGERVYDAQGKLVY